MNCTAAVIPGMLQRQAPGRIITVISDASRWGDAGLEIYAGAKAGAFAVAMAITLLISWVGLGSRTTREGAHRVVDAAAPDTVWTVVLGALLLLLLTAVVLAILARGGMVDYFPFPQGPRLDAMERALTTWPVIARGEWNAAGTRINARPTAPKPVKPKDESRP